MNWLGNLIKDIVDNWRTIPDDAIVIAYAVLYIRVESRLLKPTSPSTNRLLGPTGSGRSTVRLIVPLV